LRLLHPVNSPAQYLAACGIEGPSVNGFESALSLLAKALHLITAPTCDSSRAASSCSISSSSPAR
jgi:hypothetical protein